MTDRKTVKTAHPGEEMLAGYLSGDLEAGDRASVEAHLASCDECLEGVVSAYDAVKEFGRKKAGGMPFMKKLNLYLILAVLSFTLSFAMPRYFLQFLVATLLLGIKWVVDSKTTRMLITVHEALKRSDVNRDVPGANPPGLPVSKAGAGRGVPDSISGVSPKRLFFD